MSLEVQGIESVLNNIDSQLKVVNLRVRKSVRAAAFLVEGEAIKSIQRGTKTGRTYKRGKKEHQASAPGQAPATDSGNLVSSIAVVQSIGEQATYLVGASAPYAKDLEFGTSKMAARPWLIPALESKRKEINQIIEGSIK